jgi:hypothetical protein
MGDLCSRPHALESSLSTPVKKLYRFRKIMLEPGEVQTVSFTIPVSDWASTQMVRRKLLKKEYS